MTSNNISLVRGTSYSDDIKLVDESGEFISAERLKDAYAEFMLKTTPTAPTNVLLLTTADPTRLLISSEDGLLHLYLLPEDTQILPLALYAYQITVVLTDGSHYVPVEYSLFDLNLGGIAAPPPPVFDNTTKIDHNWDLPDSLRYVTPGGTPIADAQVRVYYKTDYDAGQLNHPVGITETDAYGRWKNPVLVLPGFSYVIRFDLPNQFGPDAVTIIA